MYVPWSGNGIVQQDRSFQGVVDDVVGQSIGQIDKRSRWIAIEKYHYYSH